MTQQKASKSAKSSSEDEGQRDLLLEISRLEKTVEWMHDLIWQLLLQNNASRSGMSTGRINKDRTTC